MKYARMRHLIEFYFLYSFVVFIISVVEIVKVIGSIRILIWIDHAICREYLADNVKLNRIVFLALLYLVLAM